MKCQKCGAEEVRIIDNSYERLKFECDVCGRIYELPKVPIGKKFVSVYVGAISQRLLREHTVVIEARGFDINNALIIVGFFVIKDKIAVIDDVEVSFHLDNKGKIVPTERVVLKKFI